MKLEEIKRDTILDWMDKNLSAWDLEKQTSVLGVELAKYLIGAKLVVPANLHLTIGYAKDDIRKPFDPPITFGELSGLTIRCKTISSFNAFDAIMHLGIHDCDINFDLTSFVARHNMDYVSSNRTFLTFNDVEKFLQMDLNRYVYSMGPNFLINSTLAGIHVTAYGKRFMLDDIFEFQDLFISNAYDKDQTKFKQ